MKNFCFFIEQEGGMSMEFLTKIEELRKILGAQSHPPYTTKPDEETERWFRYCEVGEYHTNRLGCIVRLKDDNESKHT
jgi:hypothetical protein